MSQRAFEEHIPTNVPVEVEYDYKDVQNVERTVRATARRTSDSTFEVEVVEDVLFSLRARKKQGFFQKLEAQSKKYINDIIDNWTTSFPSTSRGVTMTSAVAATAIAGTRCKIDSKDIRPNALTKIRFKSPNGDFLLVDRFDEASGKAHPPKPLAPYFEVHRFDLGAGLRGEVLSADADNVTIRLERFSVSGYEGDATKRELRELFRRILKPDILKPSPRISMSQSPKALDRRQQLLIEINPPSLAEFSSKSIETFVEKSLDYLQDGSNGERAAFEFKVAGASLEQVFKVVTDTAWNRLGEFTVKNSRGWAPYRHSRFCGNLILEGVPGTGKTYALKELANELGNRKTIAVGRLATVMHPATSYEDFVEGLRPGTPAPYSGASEFDDAAPEIAVDDQADQTADASAPAKWFFEPATEASGDFQIHDGFFVAACAAAVRNPNTPYVVLLDELNRCNIPKVMGDLITTMEISKRAKWDAAKKQWDLSSAQVVTLPYSKRLFFVPDNLSIVGTMNTTDRSVAPMDAALRRRFVFVRVEPKFPEFKDETPNFTAARSQVVELNKALNKYLGADALLGHSYFYDMKREIDEGGDAAKVTEFYFDKVIFPMVVDTLVNNGCLAELNEANGAKADAPAAVFRRALEAVATLEFSGRGITQTLKLTLL